MKDKPILMCGEMVRATRDDRKTNTRRIVNMNTLKVIPRRKVTGDFMFGNTMVAGKRTTKGIIHQAGAVSGKATNGEWLGLKPNEFDFVCPYCDGITELIDGQWIITPKKPSFLWVRETWAVGKPFDGIAPRNLDKPSCTGMLAVDYAANSERIWNPSDAGRWRPSIHMPRWASRITLEVVRVMVERLGSISPNDCRAEGIGIGLNDIGARYAFGQLWNQINESRGYGWDVNPWVWAIKFRRVK